MQGGSIHWVIELVREELSRRGSDWQYIFEMEHLPLLPTKPSLIEGRYPTVGHFEGKMFSSWACEPGCYSTKPVLKWITCPTADYLSSKMPNCYYSREVVDISFDQLEVEFYVQLTLYWGRGLPLICLWLRPIFFKILFEKINTSFWRVCEHYVKAEGSSSSIENSTHPDRKRKAFIFILSCKTRRCRTSDKTQISKQLEAWLL